MEATIPDNIFAFILLSVLNTVLSFKLPPSLLDHRKWLFREREWESSGAVYQHIFKVKRWKNTLPELSDFIKTIFPKKLIAAYDKDYLERYIAESCRAELTHWGIILSSFLFTFWNGFIRSAAIILLALGLNLPYVIIQRHNRPRILAFLRSVEEKALKICKARVQQENVK